MVFDRFGKLAVRTFTAGGALPLRDAIVTIRGAGEENRMIEYSIITDVDGLTPEISLPAPAAIYSQSAGSGSASYGIYDIDVTAENYYSKTIKSVAVFDGIKTILPVNMIPSPIHENNVSYPRGNLDTLVSENERLA